MKTGIIVQARMGSTRLPGKVMIDLFGKPVIQHLIERLAQCNRVDDIIIATTTSHQDDFIVKQAQFNSIKYFRGSEENVLSRYYNAAKVNNLDTIIRITSDCPLADPFIIDNLLGFFQGNDLEVVTNAGIDLKQRTYPRGLDTEVFSFAVLEEAFLKATKEYQKEHVTPFIYENSNSVYYYKNDINYANYRWTLDTPEDLEFIRAVYQYLYKGKHDFYFQDIIDLLKKHPDLIKINEKIEQKKLT